MDHILSTIVPIFSVVAIGAVARANGFLPMEFLLPANRLVYYLAIPAMVFRSIAHASLTHQLNPTVLWLTLGTLVLFFAICWAISGLLHLPPMTRGAFIQCSFHGNLGYIGLAVAFYHLGSEGLARASILAGFVMILQNILAVVVLQSHRGVVMGRAQFGRVAAKISANPVILSALGGMLVSLAGLAVPMVVDRTLQILGGLALPAALLIIGGSLSWAQMSRYAGAVVIACLLKLGILPTLGLVLFRLAGQPLEDYLPAMIMLACPTATVAYVMAREMGADADLAVAVISVTTLLSSVSLSLWLALG